MLLLRAIFVNDRFLPGAVRKGPLGNFRKPTFLIEFPGRKGVRHQAYRVCAVRPGTLHEPGDQRGPQSLSKIPLGGERHEFQIAVPKIAVVPFPRLLEKGFELLLKRSGQLVSPQIELQEHSNPRPVVPRGIATARQRLAETLAVFPTDKSYHLLLARNGDIGEIALFDQNLALTGGDPAHASEMLALNIYDTFYNRSGAQWKGYGQAKAVIFCLLVIAISSIQLRATRSKEVQQ